MSPISLVASSPRDRRAPITFAVSFEVQRPSQCALMPSLLHIVKHSAPIPPVHAYCGVTPVEVFLLLLLLITPQSDAISPKHISQRDVTSLSSFLSFVLWHTPLCMVNDLLTHRHRSLETLYSLQCVDVRALPRLLVT